MLKRICAVFMTLVLFGSLIPATGVFAAGKGEIQLLADLGIIDVTEEKGLFPDPFTREDFAVTLNKLDQNPDNFVTDGEEKGKYAADIKGNENYGHIATLIKLGYMQTDDNNNFRPSAPVTRSDVIKALIHALSYDIVAERDGGRDSDYDRLANKLGLLKGVKISNSAELTASEVAAILANAMSVKFFSPASVDYGDESFFSRWNITKRSGKILANSSFGIASARTEFKHVNIGGTVYYTQLQIADELVGANVEYYTMNGDWGEEVVSIYINANARNNITLTASQIDSVTENARTVTITYDGRKKITLDKTAFLIVNGKTTDPSKAIFDAFKSGSVTFVDSGSSKYEVVHMTMLLQGIIDGVNKENKTVALRYDNQKIVLEDMDVYEIYLNKKTADISSLATDMVVGVACDSFSVSGGTITYDYTKASLIKLYASTKKTEGFVDGMDDDAIYIDDMPITLGAGYTRFVAGGRIHPLKLNDYVIAYRDAYGELVYYKIDPAKSSMKYGYLIKSGVDTSGLRTNLQLKIMDTNGVINLLTTEKTFVLDGTKVNANSTTYTVNAAGDLDLNKRQVIRYRAKDTVLKELDTTITRSGVENEEGSLNADLSFDPYTADQEKREIQWNVVDRQYAFGAECIIFNDDALLDDTDPADYNFSVGTSDDIGDDEYIAGYDADSENFLTCAAVWNSYGMTAQNQTTQAMHYFAAEGNVVEKVRHAINEDGAEGYQISLAGPDGKSSYFINASEVMLYQTTPGATWSGEYMSITKVDGSNLANVVKKGDIIRFKANKQRQITYIEKIFDFAYHKDGTNKASLDGSGQTYAFANLSKTTGDFFIYNFDDDATNYMSQRRVSKDFLVVYYVETGEAQLVTMADVPSAATGNSAKIFFRFYDKNMSYDSIIYVFD